MSKSTTKRGKGTTNRGGSATAGTSNGKGVERTVRQSPRKCAGGKSSRRVVEDDDDGEPDDEEESVTFEGKSRVL